MRVPFYRIPEIENITLSQSTCTVFSFFSFRKLERPLLQAGAPAMLFFSPPLSSCFFLPPPQATIYGPHPSFGRRLFFNIPCVIIFSDQEDDSDDAGDSSSEDEVGEGEVIAEFCQVSDVRGGGALGDWERHTKVSSELNHAQFV